MNIRRRAFSTVTAVAMAGVMCGTAAGAAQASPVSDRAPANSSPQAAGSVNSAAGADEICAILGIGSGAAGLTKALARGASWVGIGASVGCYLYTQAKKVTPAEQRAAMEKSYKNYQSKSALGKLDALGYYCKKEGGGGGGGTDSAPMEVKAGWRTIVMKGVEYKCTAIRD